MKKKFGAHNFYILPEIKQNDLYRSYFDQKYILMNIDLFNNIHFGYEKANFLSIICRNIHLIFNFPPLEFLRYITASAFKYKSMLPCTM